MKFAYVFVVTHAFVTYLGLDPKLQRGEVRDILAAVLSILAVTFAVLMTKQLRRRGGRERAPHRAHVCLFVRGRRDVTGQGHDCGVFRRFSKARARRSRARREVFVERITIASRRRESKNDDARRSSTACEWRAFYDDTKI